MKRWNRVLSIFMVTALVFTMAFSAEMQTTPETVVKAASKKSRGKLAFVDGDITYCFENNTMAIFYNQSDDPDLTMRVNCIGRVTSDLSVFKQLGDSVEVIFDVKK